MAGSLFDQLKKSGLVNEHKAKQIKKEKYQQNKKQKSQKTAQVENDAAKLAAEAAQKKAEKDRQLNLERQQRQAEKAKHAELKQVLQSNKLKGFEGEIAFNFADDKQVKTLKINSKTQKGLSNGKIRIARLGSAYFLIPDTAVEKIEQRDPNALIPFKEDQDENDGIPEEDRDYYAQFEIPDDLIW